MHLDRRLLLLSGAALVCVASPILVLTVGRAGPRTTPCAAAQPEAPPSVERPELSPLATPEARASAATVPAGSGFYAAPSGSRLRFGLDAHQASSLTLQGDAPAETSFSIATTGDLVVTILGRRAEEVLASIAYEGLQVEWTAGGQAADEALEAQAEREMAEAVHVRMASDGSILGWSFPEGMSSSTRMMERTLLGLVRFVVPTDAGDEWSTDEVDPSGLYAVDYRRSGRGERGPTIARRRKMCIPSGATPEITAVATVEDDSRAEFDLALGWLVSAECAERMHLQSEDLGLSVEATSRTRLVLEEALRETASASTELWNLAWSDCTGADDARRDAEEQRGFREREAIAGLSLENVLYDLERVIREYGLDSRESFDARELLMSFLRQRPDEMERFASLLLDGSLGRDALGVALSALGAVGSPAGQAFLADFLSDPSHADEDRTLAMLAMFQVAVPEAGPAQAIRAQWLDADVSLPLRSMTLLLLGAHALHSPERRLELLAQEERARADGLLSTYLAALGNAHMYAEVEIYLADEDPAVRASAEQVLAWQ